MTEIFTAKTVEEAKAMAVKKFGKSESQIKFEVLETAKSGIFGIGKKDAKVKATYEESLNEVRKQESDSVQEVKAEEVKPVEEVKTEEVKPVKDVKTEEIKPVDEVKVEEVKTAEEVKTEEVKPIEEVKTEEVKPVKNNKNESARKTSERRKEKSVKNEKPKSQNPEESVQNFEDDDAEYSLENFTLIEDEALINPKVKIARDYITSIFKAMDIEADFIVYQNETGAIINIESDNNGTIIGRRGETLDSVQYLCSIIANKGDKDYFRITIDCLGYRQKRKETLEQLAVKVAKSVIKTGRSQPLEPMNPYERRVIHSAISAIEGVSSRSVGEEPYRKIIISSTNPKNNRRKPNRNSDSRNDKGRKNNDRRKNNNNTEKFERRSFDFSTSFEKDYRKPKPEDSMEGGLYGKIEI